MKQLTFIFAILILFGTAGCKNTSYADFGMKSRYSLNEQEKNFYPLSQKEVDRYRECCEIDGPIYLNRAISDSSSSYDIFIGAGHETHSSELIELIENDSNITIHNRKSFPGYATMCNTFLMSMNDFHIIRVVYDEPESVVTIMFDFAFKNEKVASDFYATIEDSFTTKVTARR